MAGQVEAAPAQPVQAPSSSTLSPPRGLRLSGVFHSVVFLVQCPPSAWDHDLRELIRSELQVGCPAHELKVLTLMQDDGTYAREEDAATTRGRQIRYTVKVAHLFPNVGEDERSEGRVQLRVERAPLEHAAVFAGETLQRASSHGATTTAAGPLGKRVRMDDESEEDFKPEVKYEGKWMITRGDADHLTAIASKLQRIVMQESPRQRLSRSGTGIETLKKTMKGLVKRVSKHPSAWPFHHAVDTEKVKDYLVHIREPVDLSLVKMRVERGAYQSIDELKADLVKMCDNCTTYNKRGTVFYSCGAELLEYIEHLL